MAFTSVRLMTCRARTSGHSFSYRIALGSSGVSFNKVCSAAARWACWNAVNACCFVDEPFQVALKENMFDVGLFAARVIRKRNHVIPQRQHRREELPGIGSTPGRLVCDHLIWVAVLPTA